MSFCTLRNKNTASILETGHSASERSGPLTSQCLLCSFTHRYCRRDWSTGPLQALRVERWIRHHLYPTVTLVCSGGPSGLWVEDFASQSCNLEWKKPNIIHSFLSPLSLYVIKNMGFILRIYAFCSFWLRRVIIENSPTALVTLLLGDRQIFLLPVVIVIFAFT